MAAEWLKSPAANSDTEPNEEGVRYYTAKCLGQRQYEAKIDLSRFKEPVGEYVISVYACMASGEQFYAGTTTAKVTTEMLNRTQEE